MTPTPKSKETFGYPSHFVDPAIKQEQAWCGQYTKAFHADCKANPANTGLIRSGASSIKNRKYGRGDQDPNGYKETMTLRSEDGKPNTSFRNLNWQILKIAPKLRNVLKSQVVNNDWRVNVRTIDPMAQSSRRLEKAKILEYMTNQDAIASFEKYAKNVQLSRPIPEDDLQDLTPHSIDTYIDQNPKDTLAMETKDLVTFTLVNQDWPQKADEMMGDMVDIGVGCIHVSVNDVNIVELERWIPEKVVTNHCLTNDFRDMIRVGYYDEITVSEVKRQTKGSLGEDAYKNMAEKVAVGKYNMPASHYYDASTFTYAYDHEKVSIFRAYWFSTDKFTYVEYKNASGNTRVKSEAFDYVPFKGDPSVNAGKGMTDQQYTEHTGGMKTILRQEIRNVYRCTWVVDTDYFYNYGLMTNMPRQARSYVDTQLPVAMYTTDGMSTIGNIETLLDQFQLNWLQFQAHCASSKPPGIAIERNALARAHAGNGQAAAQVDWKKLLQLYAESGNIVYDGYDIHGSPLTTYPFQELTNGLSKGAQEHLTIMITMLDFIRNVLGINAMIEGEAPPERMGKSVMQMSFGATSNALSYLNTGYKSIYQRVCNLVLGMLPDAIQAGQLPSFQETLGMETMRFMDLNKDLGLRDMGIYIEEGPDEFVEQRIDAAIQNGIDKEWLDPEDAIYVEMEKNPYRAIQYLKLKRRQKLRQRQAMEAANIDRQNTHLKDLEQMKIAAEENRQIAEFESKYQMEALKQNANRVDKQEAFMQQVIIMKLENKLKIEEDEQLYINKKANELAAIKEQGKIDKEIARIGAKNRSQSTSKSK